MIKICAICGSPVNGDVCPECGSMIIIEWFDMSKDSNSKIYVIKNIDKKIKYLKKSRENITRNIIKLEKLSKKYRC